MKLQGSSIIVTGASGGIGAATAKKLAERGARVLLTARRKDILEEIAEEIRQAGGEAETLPADITSADDCARIVETAITKFGGLQGVLNNAGMLGPRVPLQDYSEEALRSVIEVNIVGSFLMMRAALPALQQSHEACIVNVSSYLGRYGLPDCVGYIAGKFGLEGLTQGVASEVENSHIAVVSIEPGMVATDMLRAYLISDDVSEYLDPEEVGEGMAKMFADLGPAHNGLVLELDSWLPGVQAE